MVGACATCFAFVQIAGLSVITQLPTDNDWLWLLVLAGICTVWAFSFHIHLLRFFSAFTSNLAINFEPAYGILLAAVIFKEYKDLGSLFYLGALFILAANIGHALINKNAKHHHSAPGELPV